MTKKTIYKSQEAQRKAFLATFLKKVKSRIPAGEWSNFVVFSTFYMDHVVEDTFFERALDDVFGLVRSHWALSLSRKPHDINLKVMSPDADQDGWSSPLSVVQVVMDNIPFVVQSVQMALRRLGVSSYDFIYASGLNVARSGSGAIQSMDVPSENFLSDRFALESYLSIEIDRVDSACIDDIASALRRVLVDVHYAVEDWEPMKEKMQQMMVHLNDIKGHLGAEDVEEHNDFLAWLTEYYTFLGYREYTLKTTGRHKELVLDKSASLGLLRHRPDGDDDQDNDIPSVEPRVSISGHILGISKTRRQSTVHRPGITDCISVTRYDDKGNAVGESRFIGLFTADAYDSDPLRMPLVKKKVCEVMHHSDWINDLYTSKKVLHILRTLPRDELFQASNEELYRLVVGILSLREHRKIRLFMREDRFKRFISFLVYVPRDDFKMKVCEAMQSTFRELLQCNHIDASPYFSESSFTMIYFVARFDDPYTLEALDEKAIEKSIASVGSSWYDALFHELSLQHGPEKGPFLFQQYRYVFPAGYMEHQSARMALVDIQHIMELSEEHPLEISLQQASFEHEERLSLRLYSYNQSVLLSDVVPMIENMGLKVQRAYQHRLMFNHHMRIGLHDFTVVPIKPLASDLGDLKDEFKVCLSSVWFHSLQDDAFNGLVLTSGLSAKEINVFRAYAGYLKQVRFPGSEDFIQDALLAYPEVANALMQAFHKRFDPSIKRKKTDKPEEHKALLALIDDVAGFEQDRLFRRLYHLMMATIRTNYYQEDGKKPYLSFKFDSALVPDLPKPRPHYEMYVYAVDFEAVHLRADMSENLKAARGGLRWSDRFADYRTEVLGLMKAQHVKNSIIVPSGAKGGFVVKVSADDPDYLEQGKAAYRSFIRGLLDLTDNVLKGKVVKPKAMVTYDEDDPYLVVAADKGTATFSDMANEVAASYDFWLGDAFASGGSKGYSHYELGVTARGAWESVKCHFKLLDRDITQPFTVVGIGDMSGDVFGNGMLCSDKIRLLGAFNHMHIFLDPNPDAASSYEERKRMFALPRSSWADYNVDLISKGGGIYSRKSKSIPLSEPVRTWLGVTASSLSPDQLIHHMLQAPMDLLWNGGIGTYIKASDEGDVGDAANDVLRINGDQLQAAMVGEGGNLGVTQKGRIEAEYAGVLVNTDFIDNSAGVDCSDHEVNLKIFLRQCMEEGLITNEARETLLMSMKEDVVALVLKNNIVQNIALSMAQKQIPEYTHLYQRFIDEAESRGLINRKVEFLPTNKMIEDRMQQGKKTLTRAELAVLLTYSKIILQHKLLDTDLVDDPYLLRYVDEAFPAKMTRLYGDKLRTHYLKHALASMQISNHFAMELGITFVQQMRDEMGLSEVEVVKAFVAAREILGIEALFSDILGQFDALSGAEIINLFMDLRRLVRRATRWLLRNGSEKHSIAEIVSLYGDGFAVLMRALPSLLPAAALDAYTQRKQALLDQGVTEARAKVWSGMSQAHVIFNVLASSQVVSADPKVFASLYFVFSEQLGLGRLQDYLNSMSVPNRWAMSARIMMKARLEKHARFLVESVYRGCPVQVKKDINASVAAWMTAHERLVARWQEVLSVLEHQADPDATMLSVLLDELIDFGSNDLA
jgi:glutamate dehydrogenase